MIAKRALCADQQHCPGVMAADTGMRMNGGSRRDVRCMPCNISYTLPTISSNKLPDLRFISRGAYGTVSSARHADWRVPVAVKCLQGPLLDR